LAKASIIAKHGSFYRIRQMAQMCTQSNTLDPQEVARKSGISIFRRETGQQSQNANSDQ